MKTKKTGQEENDALGKALGEALGRLMPGSIDEVITQNRGKAELRLARPDDLAPLLASVPYDSTAQDVSGWTLIALDLRIPNVRPQVLRILVGHHVQKNCGWHTSPIQQLDQATGCCRTRIGTLYRMSGPASDQPDLLRLCAWLYNMSLGDYLGAMHIFY
jgi:hypothetical protein